ncbi:MAG: DUF4091 domain-containing protein [Clostridia bacterium]|nr:DUF4091 domain-containing protein [Clostridia bacterium]
MKKAKKVTTIFCGVLAAATLGSVVSGQAPAQVNAAETVDSLANVWAADSTTLVRKDVDYPELMNGEAISVSMAKNEKESAQLLLSALKDVTSYSLETSDLTSTGGATIAKEQIAVFSQHYMQTTSRSNTTYEKGWYPDALIPLDKRIKAGETTVTAGDNQAIWITVTTDKNTESGVYTGNFTLNVNGAKKQIPVTVKVWDFAVPDECNTKSSYLLYWDPLLQGEWDNTMDMYRKYFEYFLENRITVMNLPSYLNPQDFITVLKEYYNHPKFTAYNLPYKSGKTDNVDLDAMEELIKQLVVASHEDGVNYLEKAYVYNLYMDEYDHAGREVPRVKAEWFAKKFPELLTSIETYFDKKKGAEYLDSVDGLRNSLVNVTSLAVSGYNDLSEQFNAICPLYNLFNTQSDREKLHNAFSGENEELWWYGCVQPDSPYPNYHIDSQMLDKRTVSWMQYDYEIDGNLYFMVNLNAMDGNPLYTMKPIDEWLVADRNYTGDVNGDGWLVYPGRKYGVDGPIGTVRLDALRDGLEEYEYLKILDEKIVECGNFYGVDTDYRAALRTTLDKLYFGAQVKTDTAAFQEAREEIAYLLSFASSEEKLIVENMEITPDKAVVSVLASGITLTDYAGEKIAQETVNGGVRYTFELNLNTDLEVNFSLSYTTENGAQKTFKKFIAAGKKTLVTFDNETALSLVNVSKNSQKSIGAFDGVSALAVTLQSLTDKISLIQGFTPEFTVSSDIVNGKNVDKIIVRIYNNYSKDLEVKVVQVGLIDVSVATNTLKAREWTELEFSPIAAQKISGFKFQFANEVLEGNVGATYPLYVEKIMYTEGK